MMKTAIAALLLGCFMAAEGDERGMIQTIPNHHEIRDILSFDDKYGPLDNIPYKSIWFKSEDPASCHPVWIVLYQKIGMNGKFANSIIAGYILRDNRIFLIDRFSINGTIDKIIYEGVPFRQSHLWIKGSRIH